MIEKMFPQTVSNILDYDAIKSAAKKYVEDVFVQIVESFGENLVLQSMDKKHLSEVTTNVMGNPNATLDELLDYINTDNTYHEFEFVDALMTQFPEGVEYKEFEVTGWKFPESNISPFNQEYRSFEFDGQPRDDQDHDWFGTWDSEQRLLVSRFGKQMVRQNYWWEWDIKRTSGRRTSWGNSETWMTTGGFGKPATIHINVDEERSLIEENGLSSVENWLGTVSNKLPINLYIEINNNFSTRQEDSPVVSLAGSTNGYKHSFPYWEEEGFCTNDPAWEREEYYERRPQEEEYFIIWWIDTKKEYDSKEGWVCREQIYITDEDSSRLLPDKYKPYLNKQLLSGVSGISVEEIDENFWTFLINNEDVLILHRAVQISSIGGQSVVATWNSSLENTNSRIGFMFTDGRIYIAEDNTDFSSHIFEDIHYGDDGWIAITDYNPSRGAGSTMVKWDRVGIPSPFYIGKYLIRNKIECTQEYANNIIEVSALHMVADENGLAYPSLADYLVEKYFGATFAIMMPSTWFDVKVTFDNKDNQFPINS